MAVGTISPRSLYASTSKVAGRAASVSLGFFAKRAPHRGLDARFERVDAEGVHAHLAVHEQREPRRAAQAELPRGFERARHPGPQASGGVVDAEAVAEAADVHHGEAHARPVERRL